MHRKHRGALAGVVMAAMGCLLWLTRTSQTAPPVNSAVKVPTQAASGEKIRLRRGEISISGNIVSLDAKRRVIRFVARSFTLPSGKSRALRVPTTKSVFVSARTSIHRRGDGARQLSLLELKPGTSAVITGPDAGTGKAITARFIEILSGPGIGAGNTIVGAPSDLSKPQLTDLQIARANFQTRLVPQPDKSTPVEAPPDKIFKLVSYPSAAGPLAAYLSPSPDDGKKHPVIIWITGGDCNTIGDVWSPASRRNDQTAAAYRNAGILMMFPSLRGGNDNPGTKEGFLGEVEDVLAAARFLETQNYIDGDRIYLGGHSTGGTLALLVAESSNRFRAVFSFGPIDDVSNYGENSGILPFAVSDPQEVKMRSPIYWLSSIQSPTWVFEGAKGNIESLREMARVSTNPLAHFVEIKSGDHFNILAPTNELIARKILKDKGETTSISISEEEVNDNFKK